MKDRRNARLVWTICFHKLLHCSSACDWFHLKALGCRLKLLGNAMGRSCGYIVVPLGAICLLAVLASGSHWLA
eukprot:6463949-Amphidinium_carterae.1